MQKYAKAFLYISKLNLSYQKKICPYQQQQQQQQQITLLENFVRIKKILSYKEKITCQTFCTPLNITFRKKSF